MTAVLQGWVCDLTFMQQSVLIAAVRAPDGLRKDHPVKVVMRWYRRCVMLSAFEGKALADPFSPGGGSFTGPFEPYHAITMGIIPSNAEVGDLFISDHPDAWKTFDQVRDVYLRHVDEMPHHFQLHFMHAAQIVGYKHADGLIQKWWRDFYEMIVNDAHLYPESKCQMDARLGDNESGWRAREVVTAR
jgi:hypothetical protein